MAFRHPSAGTYTFDTLSAAETAFNFTDPIGTGLQSGPVNRRWNWDSDETPSTGVGPSSGAGGSPDGYVYNETSDTGTGFDDEYYMELDQTLDASSNDIEVQFKTCQRGDDNDVTCVVETNENAAGWVERGTTFGGSGDPDKVATSGTQIWTQRSVDLTGLISHASTRVRIKLTLPSAGTTWHNDYGIDEVVVIGTDQLAREQDKFRFYDDGTESGSTALAAQDTDITIGKETTFHLRTGTQMVGDPPTESVTAEYKKNGDPDAEYRKVP